MTTYGVASRADDGVAVIELQRPATVVCAIEGACAGAGLGIALCADLRVAADGAHFATAFTKIGLAADSGLSRALTQVVGRSRATGLLLLGERFSAKEAYDWGLVYRIAGTGGR